MSKREVKLHGQSLIRTPLKLGDKFYYLIEEKEFVERKILTVDRRDEFELVASAIEELVYVMNTTKPDYVKYVYLTNARRYLDKVIKDFEKSDIKWEG